MQLTAALQHLSHEFAVRTVHLSSQLEQARADAERAAERTASAHAEEMTSLRAEAVAELLQVCSARETHLVKTPGCRLQDRHAHAILTSQGISASKVAASRSRSMHLKAQSQNVDLTRLKGGRWAAYGLLGCQKISNALGAPGPT